MRRDNVGTDGESRGKAMMGPGNRKDDLAARTDGAQKPSSTKVHLHIGSKLRLMFDEVVREPIPDKFKLLLEDLEKTKKPVGD